MSRYLGICFHALLLTLCGVVALLWLRTAWLEDHLYAHAVTHGGLHRWQLCVRSRADRVMVECLHERMTDPRDIKWLGEMPILSFSGYVERRTADVNTWRPKKHVFLYERGFWWGRLAYVNTVEYRFSVPHWSLLVLTGTLPALMAVRKYRGYRRQCFGLCRNCGYDLRATPGRCPECGTQPLAPAPTALSPSNSTPGDPAPPPPDPSHSATVAEHTEPPARAA